MVGAGLFQPLRCKDKGSLVNIQRTFINLTTFISLRLGSIADNHYIQLSENSRWRSDAYSMYLLIV